ncbi:hypothetical protein [Acidithiobacillus marinus]|uniref:hypothetical protein n=1 Tax=Acidithiobacillus marinus TaxID=187490 RepID=UPI001551B134|nr:hypothetical protein [Acidithiobacillus marinus]
MFASIKENDNDRTIALESGVWKRWLGERLSATLARAVVVLGKILRPAGELSEPEG